MNRTRRELFETKEKHEGDSKTSAVMADKSAVTSRHPELCPGRYLSVCENGDLICGNHPLPGRVLRSNVPRGRASGLEFRANRPLSLIATQSTVGQREHKTVSDKLPITSKKSCFAGDIHTEQS